MASFHSPFLSNKACRIVLACFSLSALLSLGGCALIGATLSTAIALTPIKLLFACLPEETQIDTREGSRPIESLRAGDLVVGYDGDLVKIQQIHGYLENANETDFYKVSFDNGAVVDLCGMHRIGGVGAKELVIGSVVSGGNTVTSISTYRGVERSYDLLTEDAGYRIGGIPVNSMINEMIAAAKTGTFE